MRTILALHQELRAVPELELLHTEPSAALPEREFLHTQALVLQAPPLPAAGGISSAAV